MRIIESEDIETVLPEAEETSKVNEPVVESKDDSSKIKLFALAKEIHEIGNKLMDFASKL